MWKFRCTFTKMRLVFIRMQHFVIKRQICSDSATTFWQQNTTCHRSAWFRYQITIFCSNKNAQLCLLSSSCKKVLDNILSLKSFFWSTSQKWKTFDRNDSLKMQCSLIKMLYFFTPILYFVIKTLNTVTQHFIVMVMLYWENPKKNKNLLNCSQKNCY